jgi:hypothetical protein
MSSKSWRKPLLTTMLWPKSTRKNSYNNFRTELNKAWWKRKAPQDPDLSARRHNKKNRKSKPRRPKWLPAPLQTRKNKLKQPKEKWLAGLANTSHEIYSWF